MSIAEGEEGIVEDASDRRRRAVFVLNAGSSSVRAAIFEVGADPPDRLASWTVSDIGGEECRMERTIGSGPSSRSSIRASCHADALAVVFASLSDEGLPEPTVVGHRIVRAPRGESGAPAFLEGSLLDGLDRLAASAPLHLPFELAAVRAARERFPSSRQVGCFDSAFFTDLPAVARRLPLPRELTSRGVERIGYHGLSYEYVATAVDLPRRTVIAHLGSGASMAALLDGRPVDTTMGFTPAGGLVMGTRPGDLDPGALVEAVRIEDLDAEGLENLVNLRSGLAGISGGEADMRVLLQSSGDDPRAADAVESFCYAARKHLGALVAVLGGIDLLVFTGGIGENAPAVRAAVLDGLEALGLQLDEDANRRGAKIVSGSRSDAEIRVVHTDEELTIARHVARLIDIGAKGEGT